MLEIDDGWSSTIVVSKTIVRGKNLKI